MPFGKVPSGAVSYTHLTSVGVQELNAFGYGAAITVGRSSDVDRTQTGIGIQAVSYTHLDVYKRQA